MRGKGDPGCFPEFLQESTSLQRNILRQKQDSLVLWIIYCEWFRRRMAVTPEPVLTGVVVEGGPVSDLV